MRGGERRRGAGRRVLRGRGSGGAGRWGLQGQVLGEAGQWVLLRRVLGQGAVRTGRPHEEPRDAARRGAVAVALVAAVLALAACAGRFGHGGRAPPPAASPSPPVESAPGGAPAPRAPETVAPPGEARSPVPAVPRAPDPQAPPGTAGSPSTALADCVDGELRRRGLNAFGDPPATPAPALGDAERIDGVLARFPEIRTTCGVPRTR